MKIPGDQSKKSTYSNLLRNKDIEILPRLKDTHARFLALDIGLCLLQNRYIFSFELDFLSIFIEKFLPRKELIQF